MIVFIVPLVAPAYCKNWPLVSALCIRTLRSLTNQTSQNYHVILVGDEAPLGFFEHPKITMIQEPFWLDPTRPGSKRWNYREKKKRGLIKAREFDPEYVMYVDADDCISSHIAEFVETNQPANGCIVRNGYTYYEGGHWLYRRPDFDLMCGSSIILRFNKEDFPTSMTDNAEDFRHLRVRHNEFREELRKNGTLVEVPFRGTVYMIGHGENMRGMAPLGFVETFKRAVSHVVRAQPLTSKLRQEYGIYDLAVK